MSPVIGALLFLSFVLDFEVSGSGILSVKFLEYVNPGGKGKNLNACDGIFFGVSQCDHRFIICIDEASGENSVSNCKYGKRDSGVIKNQNSIKFKDKIGSLSNPQIFKFSSWPGLFKFKTEITDIDKHNNDDFVEFLYKVIRIRPGNTLIDMLHGRTRLKLEVNVSCDADYFGPDCSTFCHPQNNTHGHYYCQQTTGNKICLHGWKGRHCRVVDQCAASPCYNQGTCHNTNQSFVCSCQPGFKGNLCEEKENLCRINPCHRGSCKNTGNGFVCRCFRGWTGTFCQIPQTRHGSCRKTGKGYKCVCAAGWDGERCSNDVNECMNRPCSGYSTCINTAGSYVCRCSKGWKGPDCLTDIDECEFNWCSHAGANVNSNTRCVNTAGSFKCECTKGWGGHSCLEDVDECLTESHNCGEHSKCVNTLGSFECKCLEGWNHSHLYYSKEEVLCNTIAANCQELLCNGQGSCEIGEGENISCFCDKRFAGKSCQMDVPTSCSSDQELLVDLMSYSVTKNEAVRKLQLTFSEKTGINMQYIGITSNDVPNERNVNKNSSVAIQILIYNRTVCPPWVFNFFQNATFHNFNISLMQKSNNSRPPDINDTPFKNTEVWIKKNKVYISVIVTVITLIVGGAYFGYIYRCGKRNSNTSRAVKKSKTAASVENIVYTDILQTQDSYSEIQDNYSEIQNV